MRTIGRMHIDSGFGQGGAGAEYLEDQAPPSSYAVAAWLEGQPGSGVRLMGLTALRTVFIVPGLLAGSWIIPGVKIGKLQALGLGSFVSSTITGGMILYYLFERRRTQAFRSAQNQEIRA